MSDAHEPTSVVADRQNYDAILRVVLEMVRPMHLPGFNRDIYAKHLRKLRLMIQNELDRIKE